MTSKTLRTVGLAILGTALIGVAVVYSITQRYTIVDESPESLQNMAIHAVVVVTVDEELGADSRFNSTDDMWRATINEVLWDRGDYTIVGGVGANLGLPKAGETIDISIPRRVSTTEGNHYVMALSRAYFADPKEQDAWPWQFEVGLDPSVDYVPVTGTSDLVLTELDTIKLDGESRADALVAYAVDLAAVQEARFKGTAEPATSRVTALVEGSVAQAEQEYADWYVGLDDRSRQLPQSLDELPAAARSEVGAELWGDWRIVVLFDDALAKDVGSVAIYFPGSGILGPYEVSGDETVLQMHGVGPLDSLGELMWWPEGIPSEIVYRPDALSSEDSARLVTSETTALQAGPRATGELLMGGGTWLIDLTNGKAVVEPLSDDEYRALFEKLAPPEGDPPRSELDLSAESG